MATPRRPLQEISGNSIKRKELSPYQRGQIVGAARGGMSQAEIAKAFNVAKSTVFDTLFNALERHNGESKPRSGRPLCYAECEERIILRFVRLNPNSSYKDCAQRVGGHSIAVNLEDDLGKAWHLELAYTQATSSIIGKQLKRGIFVARLERIGL
jgi:transposase